MAIGRAGSYATVDPIQKDYISEAGAFVENQAFKYREEARQLAEKKKAQEEAKLKELSDWDGKFDPSIVGHNAIDDPLLGYAMKAKQRAADITRELLTTNNFNRKVELMSERNKLKQSFDIANQQPKLIQEKVKDIQDGIEKGKYNSRDVDFIQNIAKQLESGKYELNYDNTGTPRIKIYDTDETGTPVGVLKETTLGDLVNAFQPKLAFNYETYKDSALKNVKPEVYGSQVGARVVSGSKISDANRNQAETYADVILNDPNKLYEAQYLFQERDPEKLRTKIEEDFLTSIPTGEVQTTDTGMLNYWQNVKEFKAAQKEKQTQKMIVSLSNNIKDDFVGNVVSPSTMYKNVVAVDPTKVKFLNLGGSFSDLNNGNVEAFSRDKKTGDIIVMGKALKTKGMKFKASNGEMLDWNEAEKRSTNDPALQLQLDSYNKPNNYGTFVRRVPNQNELSGLVLQSGYDNLGQLTKELDANNPEDKKEIKKQKVKKQQAKSNDPLGLGI